MKQLKIRWGFKLPSPTGKIVYQTQLYHFINLSSDEAMKIKKVTRKQINAFLQGKNISSHSARNRQKRTPTFIQYTLDAFVQPIPHKRPVAYIKRGRKRPKAIYSLQTLALHQTPQHLALQLPFSKQTFLKFMKHQHIDRFKRVPTVTFNDYCSDKISHEEWINFQCVPEFNGIFKYLITLNDFGFWDDVEKQMFSNGFRRKGFTVREMIIWDLLRLSLGIPTFQEFTDKMRDYNLKDLQPLVSLKIPVPSTFSYYFAHIPVKAYQDFFAKLVVECVNTKVIIPRILMGDGLFAHSWAGDFKKDRYGNATDQEASLRVHNRKYDGKGFVAIAFYAWCHDRWLPVHFHVFSGSKNECPIVRDLAYDFLKDSPWNWEVFLYDAGASSKDVRTVIKNAGLICAIPAKKNIKQEMIVELDNGKYFYEADFPDGMSLNKFGALFKHRAQVESAFSAFEGIYHQGRMNRMGLDAATIHFARYFILQLLHGLTAYKVNRPDLVMSAKAFTQVNL